MNRFRLAAASLAAAVFLALPLSAGAVEVAGVKLDDDAKVAGQDLKLNGAGVRTKAIFKVYAIGIYLPKKAATTDAVLASTGSRRITLVMMRDLASDELGQAFMAGLNTNSDKAEKAKVVDQIVKLGELFEGVGGFKKGDVINLDFLPEKGTAIVINGKPLGAPLPDLAFNNALLRIWLGDKPVDGALKPLLLAKAD